MEHRFTLLQLADSAFPIGTHAHSYGLEELVQSGVVGDASAAQEALHAQLEGPLARGDLVALRAAHALAHPLDLAALAALDAELGAFKTVREWREASLGAGRRLLAMAGALTGQGAWSDLRAAAQGGLLGPHHAVALGAVGRLLELEVEDLATAFTFGTVAGQLSAAARLIPLGQMAVQQTLHALKPSMAAAVRRSATYRRAEMGSGLPLLEIAGMRHERAHGRLFIS